MVTSMAMVVMISSVGLLLFGGPDILPVVRAKGGATASTATTPLHQLAVVYEDMAVNPTDEHFAIALTIFSDGTNAITVSLSLI